MTVSRSSVNRSNVTISAPSERTTSIFAAGASSGTRIVAVVPSSFADSATAMAWLPDDTATTPRARSSVGIDETLLYAPRSLNAPPRCRHSALSSTVAPSRSSSASLRSTGVRTATPSSTLAARSTSSIVTATTGRLAHVHRLARPPDAALEWAAEVVGSPIRKVKPLTGGMSTGIHLLESHRGERVVMRRFVNPHWLAIDPHLAPREAAVLQALEPTPVPAPAFVGVDPYGMRCEA